MGRERIVVVGGNAAGLTAASRARRLDPRLEILVLERSESVSTSTCGIPYFLAGDVEAGALIHMTPADFARDRRIDVHTQVEIDEVLPGRRTALGRRLDTGEAVSFGFDRLLFSTGVLLKPPDIPGTDLPGVLGILTLDDAIGARPQIARARRIGIVGAGYVGLEMAETMRRLGKDVVLCEQQSGVMPALDRDLGRIVEYELERHGVRVRTQARILALVGDEDGVHGMKGPGEMGVEPVDAVLLDTGVRPNTDLAVRAGVRIGPSGGIMVSPGMETNLPGIFAAGNCAEAFSILHGRGVLQHLGTVAARQGRVAGDNLAGRRTRFRGTIGTTLVRVFELGVGKAGLSEEEATAERIPTVSARIEALDRATYFAGSRKIWVKLLAERESGRVVGIQVVGYGDVARRLDVGAAAITAGMSADEVATLDLGYTPPFGTLWDPLHLAAQAVLRKL